MAEVARHLRELIVATDDYRRTMAAEIGVSTTEAAVLGQLLHEGALTPSAIATRTGLTPASATALIDRLVSAALVHRSPHPDDRRRVLVDLTGQGRSAIESMFSLFVSDLDEALRRAEPRLIDDPELRRTLTGVFRAMAGSLRTHAGDAGRITPVPGTGTAGEPSARPGPSTPDDDVRTRSTGRAAEADPAGRPRACCDSGGQIAAGVAGQFRECVPYVRFAPGGVSARH